MLSIQVWIHHLSFWYSLKTYIKIRFSSKIILVINLLNVDAKPSIIFLMSVAFITWFRLIYMTAFVGNSCRRTQQSSAHKRRRDVGLIISAAAILNRWPPSYVGAAISLLLHRRRTRSKVLHTKGSHVILRQQCHHFLTVGSRRGQSEVDRRSPQRGVKGLRRVCSKPVKWSFIFISDRCW